jgi:RNA polymerase sigma-54 factor
MTSLASRLDARQQQKLSPRLQQAVRLLQLSSLEYAQEVRATLEKNPFLEIEDEPSETPDAEAESPTPTKSSDDAGVEPDAPLIADDGERDAWQIDGNLRNTSSGDGSDNDPINLLVAGETLAEHLHLQLNVLTLPERDLLLAGVIVESLDDDGYLRQDLDELATLLNMDPPVAPEEMQIALKRVQALEPAGVGARDLCECLRLQLGDIECPTQRALIEEIVSHHLQTLATREPLTLARALGRPPEEVDAACARLRRLDPHPGSRFDDRRTQYITPDIIVKKVRGVWTASLNPQVLPRVRLNAVYAEMMQRQRGRHPDLSGQLQEARWVVRNIEQRFATILGVAQAIVGRQHAFFDHGQMAMRPLGLREIAQEVGLHESTVSRVTHQKYMATPNGVLELKYFFSRAMTATSGAAFSGTAVQGLVKEMLESEPPGARLSDAEIARRLARQGLSIARRTVTKYRHLLKVESVERRKHEA